MELAELWKAIIVGDNKTWVVFEYGTCVVVMNHQKNPEFDSLVIMKEFGPVHPGTPSGDINVTKLSNLPGWIVTYDHPDILNYVSPDEIDDKKFPIIDEVDNITIGLLGRNKRKNDSISLKILHIEDKRIK